MNCGGKSVKIFFVLVLISFLSGFLHSIVCEGSDPPCDISAKTCAQGSDYTCQEGSDGKCQCVPAVCPAPATSTFMNVFYEHEKNAPDGKLEIELYYITADPISGEGVVNYVKGGLIIIDGGRYVGGATFDPYGSISASKVCKTFTNSNGKVAIKFPFPQNPMKKDFRVIFCPYVDSTAQDDLAVCARVSDEKANLHKQLDYTQIPNCDDSWPASALQTISINSETKNIWDALAPSETSFEVLNNSAPRAQTAFCWGLALVFGLL